MHFSGILESFFFFFIEDDRKEIHSGDKRYTNKYYGENVLLSPFTCEAEKKRT
jgi:hypothetical protein